MRMRDIAKAVGVSTMTVSRALRSDASVAPATREAILKVIEEQGYVPDQIASSLSSRKSGFVAVLVPSLNNPHFSETVLALTAELSREGLQTLIGSTNYDSQTEAALVRAFLSRKPEAFVLTNDGHSPELRKLLSGANVPIIEIWDLPAGPLEHVVGFSNETAMRMLATALIDRGYRRITYAGENVDAGTRGAARRQGFMRAMAERGLPPRQCAIGRPPATMSNGEQVAEIILRDHPDTDLVMCVSDPLAFGVIAALQRRGRQVPRDIAVAGFGDFEISRVALPTITTVKVDPGAIGRLTADLILDLRKPGMAPAQTRRVTVETTVDIRQSAPGLPA